MNNKNKMNNKTIITNNKSISCSIGDFYLSKENPTNDFKISLAEAQTEQEILDLFGIKKNNLKEAQNSFKERINNSKVLSLYGDSVILKNVSNLNLPNVLIESILEAEENNNDKLLNSYINFWKLCLRNPNEYARNNLFWYMKKWGIELNENGLFYLYRNVVSKLTLLEETVIKYSKELIRDKSLLFNYNLYFNTATNQYFLGLPISVKQVEETNIYVGNMYYLYLQVIRDLTFTDDKTGTFKIKLGEFVSMNRSDCDETQENDCSRGLHAGAKSWLQPNYFGNTPIKILVNPMDVVAIPPVDNYGKIRVCKYLPTQIVEWSGKGNEIIESVNNEEYEGLFLDDIKNNPVYYDTIKVESNILSQKDLFYSVDNGKEALEYLRNKINK